MNERTKLAVPLSQIFAGSRTYKPSGVWAVFLLIGSVGFAIAGAFGIWYLALGRSAQTQPGALVLGLGTVAAAFLSLGAYMLAELVTSRIELTSDSIEIRHPLSTTTLNRTDLAGWRTLPTSPPALVLVPRDAAMKKVKIADIYGFDEVLDSWLEPLPNLDSEERDRIETAIKHDPQLGFTESERVEALRNATRTARLLNIVAGAVTGWAYIYPHPYKPLIFGLLVLPFVSLAAIKKFPALITIDRRRNDPRPTVGITFMFPGFGLMLRTLSDIHLFSWTSPAILALTVSAAVWAAAFFVDTSVRKQFINAVAVYLILVPYGFGSVLEWNAVLDHSSPTTYSARVLSKEITTGKHTDYRLQLGYWGIQYSGKWESVPVRVFRSVRVGDTVCLPVRQGALRIPWYIVTTCK